MNVLGIIPARFASTRFPGKPLADVNGKSMIQCTWEQAKKTKSIHKVVVATDDQRIFDHVIAFGGEAVMTNENHPSGTDRCFEAVQKTTGNFDVVINIQGDEPFVAPDQIDQLVACFNDPGAEIATLARKITTPEFLSDPNKVKVVFGNTYFALYFSRQAIPFLKGVSPQEWLNHYNYFLHIGLYGYRLSTLEAITLLAPGRLEKAESLEQLRWLENGYRIKVAETQHESFGVDTPEDLKTLLKSFGK